MKIEMKKIFLLLIFAFLSVQFIYADGDGGGPPTPPGCDCCATLPESQKAACISNCLNSGTDDYCDEVFPINSNILFLFATAISLGGYFLYKNCKKNLHLK